MSTWRSIPILFLMCVAPVSEATVPSKAVFDAVQAESRRAERGDVQAMNDLGWRLFNGDGVPQDYAQAVRWFRAAAAQGNVSAVYGLAHCLLDGKGVAADATEGNRLLRIAAEAGNGSAQINLGYAAEQRKDWAEARRWYEKAASLGESNGSYNLGQMYRYGKGVPADLPKAFQLYLQAAGKGDTDAIAIVADMLFEGRYAPLDESAAAKMFAQAAADGIQEGEYWLAVCYEYGKGVPKDEVRAAQLYQQVIDLFDTRHRFLVMQIEGRGMPQDKVAAYAAIDEQIRQGKISDILFLGLRLLRMGNQTEAEPVLQRAQAALPNVAKDARLASALAAVGRYYANYGRTEPAERYLKEALALLETLPDVPQDELAKTLDTLGKVYLDDERLPLAESTFRRSLELRSKALGQRDESVASSYRHLAQVKAALGENEAAEQYVRTALELTRARTGDDSAETADARSALAGRLYYAGKYQEAESLFLQSLAVQEAQLGKDHWEVLMTLSALAYNYLQLEKLDLAENSFRRVNVQFAKFTENMQRVWIATGQNNLGVVMLARKRYPEAEKLMLEGLAIREEVLGPEGIDVPISLRNLGKLYVETGRYAQADAAFQRALAIEGENGKENWEVAEILHEQGVGQQKQGHHEQAVGLLRRTLDIRFRLRPRHPMTADTANALAAAYRKLGQDGAALEVERRMIATTAQAPSVDAPAAGIISAASTKPPLAR